MGLDTNDSRNMTEHLGSLDRGISMEPERGVMFFAILKSIGHEQLLRQYAQIGKEEQGLILLSNEFADIFKAAKLQANVEPELVLRDSPGLSHFETDTVEKAVALCEAVLLRVEELNRGVKRRLRKRVVVGIDVLRSPTQAGPANWVHQGKNFLDGLASLIEPGSAGQIWITENVYRMLPGPRREPYRRNDKSCRRVHGSTDDWFRQVTDAPNSNATDVAIMDVDMARSMPIEKHMRGVLNDASQASTKLKEQIQSIIRNGFASAGGPSYDECHENDTGDGGIFLLPNVADAHAAGVRILNAAHEYNRLARDDNNEMGLRCFRIGISHGRLSEDGNSNPDGNKFAEAKRIEEWGPTGEIRMTEEAFGKLPANLQKFYGGPEQIPGKKGESPICARRYMVTDRALWVEKDKETGKEYPPITPPTSKPQTVNKPVVHERCFIVTPLRDEKRSNDVYEELIVPACLEGGYDARRATQIAGPPDQAIATSLGEAPMVVAYLGRPDANGNWNPNVILEIGYRLATRLPLVILGDSNLDGSVPDYQATLPFQLVHHKVITVKSDPAESLADVIHEIADSKVRRPRSQWDTPLPIIEFKFTNFSDIVITEANEAARELFGEENVRENAPAQKLTESISRRTDGLSGEPRRDEIIGILERLETWHRNRLTGAVKRVIPQPRIPIVFTDKASDSRSGKPEGYLPVVVRYTLEGAYIHVRLLYLKVSESMTKDPILNCYVCNL